MKANISKFTVASKKNERILMQWQVNNLQWNCLKVPYFSSSTSTKSGIPPRTSIFLLSPFPALERKAAVKCTIVFPKSDPFNCVFSSFEKSTF